ncbi:MAG: hypothetical protein VW450_08370 [Chloroflexota bacterium]
MRIVRALLLSALALMGVLALAACGGADPTATPTATPKPADGGTAATPTPTPQRDLAAYFQGKTIVVNVGFSPGGGYDTFSRLMAKHIARYIPGNPKLVVRNLPGAGGERVFKATFTDLPANGLATAILHPRFVKSELLGIDVEHFDLNTVRIVGTASAVNETQSYYVKRATATTWAEVLASGKTLTDGATAPGDTGSVGPTFVQLLGGPIKMIYGYGGTNEIAAAFDRDELAGTSRGNYTSAPRLYPEWIASKSIVPLFRWGAEPADDPLYSDYVTKDLGAAIPPHVYDIVSPSEGQKAVFEATEVINDNLQRTFLLSPDTDEDIVQAWQEAFEAMVADPAFVADALTAGYSTGYAGEAKMRVALANAKKALDADPALKDLFTALAGAE